MSESKHTPGPWEIAPSMNNHRSVIYKPEGDEYIPEIHAIAFTVIRDQRTMEEIEANARLIAAAPDLLEALKELGDWLAYGLDKPDGAKPTAEDMLRCQEVAAKARAAVDKATGATQ